MSHTCTGLEYLDRQVNTLPKSLDPFTITKSNGFMPLRLPIKTFPPSFKALGDLLAEMPVTKLDGTPGMLASFQLGTAIDEKALLPDLTPEVDRISTSEGMPDLEIITALFRDYSFLASAYLLEPCYERHARGLSGYGHGRAMLPWVIAGPLVKCAALLDVPPFLAYAAAYALYNFYLDKPSAGLADYSNLRLIRAFEYGLDPASSEAGFILTHVDMVKHSPDLVRGAMDLLASLQTRSEVAMQSSWELLLSTLDKIHTSMERMWAHSKPTEYINYRVFLFGIKNQSMFPEGVVYQGCFNNEPQFYRGESGANDAMVPLMDTLLEIPFPQNPLTDHLTSFRDYRPAPHRQFLASVRSKAQAVRVRAQSTTSPTTAILYLRVVDSVMRFRWRHWTFAREYILRRTSHPTASGGSPVITWLPNQLSAMMDVMDETWNPLSSDDQDAAGHRVNDMMSEMWNKREKLNAEVEKWCTEKGHAR